LGTSRSFARGKKEEKKKKKARPKRLGEKEKMSFFFEQKSSRSFSSGADLRFGRTRAQRRAYVHQQRRRWRC